MYGINQQQPVCSVQVPLFGLIVSAKPKKVSELQYMQEREGGCICLVG